MADSDDDGLMATSAVQDSAIASESGIVIMPGSEMERMDSEIERKGADAPVFPKDLVIVTHRGPISVSFNDADELVAGTAAGGLAPSLTRALTGSGTGWIACAMSDGERRVAELGPNELVPGIKVTYLALDPSVIDDAYNHIANETLWFIHHNMAVEARVVIDDVWLDAYANFRLYNQEFARAIMASAPEGATVMVNDYHLPLVGKVLADERPDLATLHFSHTPFAQPDQLGLLPRDIAEEILVGMTSFGACGFHIERWAAGFRACVKEFGLAPPKTFTCPLGVDAEGLHREAMMPVVQGLRALNAQRFAGKKLIFRSDRLEPTKNIVRGFLAFENLLEEHPHLVGEVYFLARSYLSRSDIAFYQQYRDEVESIAHRVNARFGSPDYQPVIVEIDDVYRASLAAYFDYDVLLVNPLLDGMNLVAKEAPIINVNNGVVVLSEGAGAYDQLREVTLGVDPFDIRGTSDALYRALFMDHDERQRRAVLLQQLAGERPPARWLEESLAHARRP